MKAVIIENEYQMVPETKQFLDDNPGLFESVDLQIACRNRSLKDVAESVLKADAVIVYSTFMYKDQLEEFVEAFANGPFSHKKYSLYIDHLVTVMNEWNEKKEPHHGEYKYIYDFSNKAMFIANLHKIMKIHDLYNVRKAWLEDDSKYAVYKVLYSPDLDVFYDEDTDPQQEFEWLYR